MAYASHAVGPTGGPGGVRLTSVTIGTETGETTASYTFRALGELIRVDTTPLVTPTALYDITLTPTGRSAVNLVSDGAASTALVEFEVATIGAAANYVNEITIAVAQADADESWRIDIYQRT